MTHSPLKLLSLPLFPLQTVLFPAGQLPLRIFETRYRSMVRCCRAAEAPFGVVTLLASATPANHAQPHFHHIGTLAHIDGSQPMSQSMELLQCTGQTRFRITQRRRTPHGLWIADVEMLPDDKAIPIPSDLQHSATALRQVLHKLSLRQLPLPSDQQLSDCSWVANRWCELLPMPQHVQLHMLELDSPLLRLELVTDALERAGIVS